MHEIVTKRVLKFVEKEIERRACNVPLGYGVLW
jgi:hypothetical protein